jgi:hypothetical protein
VGLHGHGPGAAAGAGACLAPRATAWQPRASPRSRKAPHARAAASLPRCGCPAHRKAAGHVLLTAPPRQLRPGRTFTDQLSTPLEAPPKKSKTSYFRPALPHPPLTRRRTTSTTAPPSPATRARGCALWPRPRTASPRCTHPPTLLHTRARTPQSPRGSSSSRPACCAAGPHARAPALPCHAMAWAPASPPPSCPAPPQGDLINRRLRQFGQWGLSPAAVLVGTLMPATYMRGYRETFGQCPLPATPHAPRPTTCSPNPHARAHTLQLALRRTSRLHALCSRLH